VDRCCEVEGNSCFRDSTCTDHTSSSDYLYRLSPGEPERVEPTGVTPETFTNYQYANPIEWPNFGYDGNPFSANNDLRIGATGPPGTSGYCGQGSTYRGSPNAACGGQYNWGHTDLEVWRLPR